MTVILAIDTATGPCSAAVWKDGRVAAYRETMQPGAQSAALMPMVESALKEAGINYNDLTAVAATIGPGSFTGIRVGLAAARGIAFAANVPSLGFTTLEALAFALKEKVRPVLAILNAGKGEWYYQGFSFGKPLFEPRLGTYEEATASINNARITGNAPGTDAAFPRADALAELAATHPVAHVPLVPFYIRPPDAKLPQNKHGRP